MTNKPFTLADIKDLIQQFDTEEISMSRFTEILNEKTIAFSDAAREDEAIAFNRWRDGQSWECTLHDDEDVKHWQRYGEGETLTDKELYKRYKKQNP